MSARKTATMIDLALFGLEGVSARFAAECAREIAAMPEPRTVDQVRAVITAHAQRAVFAIDAIAASLDTDPPFH